MVAKSVFGRVEKILAVNEGNGAFDWGFGRHGKK
jgi:hypothetical protein